MTRKIVRSRNFLDRETHALKNVLRVTFRFTKRRKSDEHHEVLTLRPSVLRSRAAGGSPPRQNLGTDKNGFHGAVAHIPLVVLGHLVGCVHPSADVEQCPIPTTAMRACTSPERTHQGRKSESLQNKIYCAFMLNLYFLARDKQIVSEKQWEKVLYKPESRD